MTYTKFLLSQANQKQTMQLQNRIADLEKTVHMLLSQNQGKGSCRDESPSQVNKYDDSNTKCNLLDWTGMDEIVAEGRVLSTDPKELLYNIPLGPNAMKILIEFPKKLDAFLWRPTSRMISHIGEAKDEIIAWPADRVVLHTMIDSEKDDVMSKTNIANNKCKLYDWIGSKELVAEGRLYSSDPNQLVNNIPLGQSAMLVLIDESKKPNAFLWRPPIGMKYVGEAVGCKVAWPQKNVVVDVIKVPNAPLWRPTSEFEFIEDAIGSNIAWPSANVVTESTSSN